MRQAFKTHTYLADRLDSRLEFIEQLHGKLAEPRLDRRHRLRLRGALFRKRLEYLISRFTWGDGVVELRPLFEPTVAALEQWSHDTGGPALDFDAFDAYVHGLWIVSLATLLDVDDPLRDKCIDLVANRGRDALYDWLVSSQEAAAGYLMYADPYLSLFEAVEASETEQVDRIHHFLQHYYQGMSGSYWHDAHLGKDAGYFGYWSFEAAALVKRLKLDEDLFLDSSYFPSLGS